MRRRRSHSTHLTRSRRHHRHGSRSRARRGGGLTLGSAIGKAPKYMLAAFKRNEAEEKAAQAKADRLQGIGKGVATPSTARMFPGATASNFRPSSFPSRASSGSPHRKRATAANLQVVPEVVPGRLSAVHEDELALLTSNKFSTSGLANTGARAAAAQHNTSPK